MKISSKTLKMLMYFQIFFMMFLRFFTANLNILYQLNYLAIINFILMVILGALFLKGRYRHINKNIIKAFGIIFFLFLPIAVISYVKNTYGIGLCVLGLYLQLRLPVFILLCIIFFRIRDVNKIDCFIVNVIYLDAVFMTVQFIFLGLRQDFIGGMFGNTQGCNGIQNVVCCLGIVIMISKFLYKEISAKKFFSFALVTCYMAAIAELTIYFVELAVMIVVAVIVSRRSKWFSLRKLGIIMGSVTTLIGGFALLIKYFPTKARLLDLKEILLYLGAKNSPGVYSISRINGIRQVRDLYMPDAVDRWIGLGLGSTLEGSEFYANHINIHYDWFSSTLTMLESGYIGIIYKLSIFIVVGINSLYILRCREDNRREKFAMVSLLISILCIILFFYNNSLDDKYCVYLMAYGLSIGVIGSKEFNQ